jgi:D-alanine-D-alanine ligase
MRVALLHNPRPEAIPDGMPEDTFEEYDGAETIEAIAGALGEFGASVEPVIADGGLPGMLAQKRYDFAFNIAEGWGGRHREATAPAVCELLGVPYTGSDPLTLAVTLDKWMARRIVSPEVPVAAAVLVREEQDVGRLGKLRYPAIVKPNDEGSSKGIRNDSVADTEKEALERVRELRRTYHCPVLVEEFLAGPEVTVGVMGNGESRRVLGLMEIAPRQETERFVYSLEVKRDFARQVQYHVPPRMAAAVTETIAELAQVAYELLGCRDVARFDFRLDAAGQPYFLECNPLPGLNPESGDIVILSRARMRYAALVQEIFQHALRRTGVEWR